MPQTLRVKTGDGITSVLVDAVIQLPDSGNSYSVAGTVQAPGQPAKKITGSPLTGPANPGSGSIFWQIVVDWTTGAASVVQSTVADPAPVDAGPKALPLLLGPQMPAAGQVPITGRVPAPADESQSVVIFRQTLVNASPAAAWANATNATPDLY